MANASGDLQDDSRCLKDDTVMLPSCYLISLFRSRECAGNRKGVEVFGMIFWSNLDGAISEPSGLDGPVAIYVLSQHLKP